MNNKKTVRSVCVISCSLLFLISATTQAENDKRQRRGPPPEAFDACINKSESEACFFNAPRGEIEGSCIIAPHENSVLICAPAGGPPHDRGSQ